MRCKVVNPRIVGWYVCRFACLRVDGNDAPAEQCREQTSAGNGLYDGVRRVAGEQDASVVGKQSLIVDARP